LMADQPSLRIGFGESNTVVRLTGAPGWEDGIAQLTMSMGTASYRSRLSIEVELDSLIANLMPLTAWPDPDGVEWTPELAKIVEDSLADAQAVEERLEREPASVDEVAREDVMARLGSNWRAPLTGFQLRDIAKLLSLRHGANFSVPGSGKTRVALAVFSALQKSAGLSRILIVGPKSSYESWLAENQECFKDTLRMGIFGCEESAAMEALIVNYERLNQSLTELSQWLAAQPSMLLLDEAHRMKLGPEGTYGGACLALGPRADRRLILTGTPAPNGAKDLENLMSFVWPGQGRANVRKAIAGGDLRTASQALSPLFTRTTKAELGLPPLRIKSRLLAMPELHAEIYDALIGRFSTRVVGAESDFQALGKITTHLLMAANTPALLSVGSTRYEPLAYRVSPLEPPKGSALFELMQDLPSYELSPKYREVLKLVADNVRLGRKTLVWSTFIRSLTTLQRMMYAFSPALVHGGTDNRDEEIQRFRADPDCWVLLSNPATLGEGINLHQTCHDSIFVDRDFAAGRFLQAVDRLHRLGLPSDVETRVTVLMTKASIDEVVEQRLATKLQFMGGVLDDRQVQAMADLDEEPPTGAGLDTADVAALMMHLRGHTI
jgi:SNF2 family DNA or RNA helicase